MADTKISLLTEKVTPEAADLIVIVDSTVSDNKKVQLANAGKATKLDDLAAPDDNTDLNASITKHGLCPKFPNDALKFLRGDATFAAVDRGEGHITIFGHHYSSIIQGTWVFFVTASQFLYGFIYNNPSAQNDQIDYQVYLAAGTYTFQILGTTNPDRGISTVYIGGNSVGTMDWYSGGTVWNVIKSIAGISITTPGLYTLSVKMATKNGSSSGYAMTISSMALFRTA